MAFDVARFSGASLTLRTRKVPVVSSDLTQFFDEGDVHEVELRQLDGCELARCLEAPRINRDIGELVQQMTREEAAGKATAIREMLGIGDKVPDEVAKRIEMLCIASVNPKFDREAAIKLCRYFPIEFMQWTRAIENLSAEGGMLGEASGSGKTQPSERP